MKHILVAVALSALPAAAFAQGVVCQGCDHVAPYFRGEGGFIATVAEGVDEVVFVASCGNVTTTGEADAGGGTVAQLFTFRNGLACDGDEGSLEIAGVEDGGWYWITDDRNSAVGSLIGKDVLDNEPTAITSAGAAVSMTKGRGAVYLKEAATGRVGILSNILPEAPPAPLRKCGFSGAATAASPAVPVKTECALGDGGTTVLATSTHPITGATVRIMDEGSVTRPGGTGLVTIVADLWGNGSGHFVTTHDATTANGISAMRGQQAVALSDDRAETRLTGVTYGVSLRTGGPGAGTTIDSGSAVGGVDWSEAANAATITVGSDSTYCGKDDNHPATVVLTATMATATDVDQVTPSVVRDATSGAVGGMSFTVVCP